MAAEDIGGALDLTLASLREGVVGLGVEAALPEISAWEERLSSSGDPGLEAVAATLGEVGAKVGEKLARLGALLGSEGDSLTDKMTRV